MNRFRGLLAGLFLLLSSCLHMQTGSDHTRVESPASAPIAGSASDSSSRTCPCTDAQRVLPSAAAVSEIDRILAFYVRFQQLPAVEQQREYQNINRTHEREPSLISAYQLALALLTPQRDFSDPDRARQLLSGNHKDQPPPAEVAALGRLLLAMSADNQKLRLRLKAEEENSATIKRQLDELRNIETIIKDRSMGSTPDTRL